MIQQLRVENFKSWRDTEELRFAPLTAFFGPNSSGKSSILQALLMLKQTVESSDRQLVLSTSGAFADLGTYRDIFYRRDQGRRLRLTLEWTTTRLRPSNGLTPGKIVFQTAIRHFGTHIGVEKLLFEFLDEGVGLELHDDQTHYRAVGSGKVLGDGVKPLKCYGLPSEITAGQGETARDLTLFFEDLFRATHHLGPLREAPRRHYAYPGSQPDDVGVRGENAAAALHADKYRTGGAAEETVQRWLAALGLASRFRTQALTPETPETDEVRIQVTGESTEVGLPDAGFGISQVLPVLVQCAYASPGSILILEQPEIHLHPAAQSELADILIEAVRERNVQLIIESHSEHLLHRLQRRIAEGVFPHHSAALYFCQTGVDGSSAKALDLDEYGNIRNWPRGFFGDVMGDLTAMTKAGLKKKAG